MTKVELKEKAVDFIRKDIMLTGLDFCLIGLVCLFAGICIGLLTAPFTHGVSLCSNNWSNNGHNSSNGNGDRKDNKVKGRKEGHQK